MDTEERLHRQLRRYVDRLLPRFTLSNELLTLAVAELEPIKRLELLEHIHGLSPTKDEGTFDEYLLENPGLIDDPSWLASCVVSLSMSRQWIESVERIRSKLIELYQTSNQVTGHKQDDPFADEIVRMSSVFRLDSMEREIVLFFYTCALSECFAGYVEGLPRLALWKALGASIDVECHTLPQALSSSGRLVSTGIIEVNRYAENVEFHLTETALEILSNNDTESLLDRYCTIDSTPGYDLESFPVDALDIDIALTSMRTVGAGHLLLHGDPGTGKTEFARAIAHAEGCRPAFVRTDSHSFITTLTLCRHMATNNDILLVVDEADSVLNTEDFSLGLIAPAEQSDRGRLCRLMDETAVPMIWIANSISGMAKSVRRRFAYSIRFDQISFDHRRAVWIEQRDRISRRYRFTDDEIARFAKRYSVDAGSIAIGLRIVENLAREDQAREAPPPTLAVQRLMQRKLSLLGNSNPQAVRPKAPRYDVAVLNTDVGIASVLDALRSFSAAMAAADPPIEKSMNLILWGKPGTGKTEFARRIASELDTPLVVRRASDILGRYVGETEQNIRDSFQEASQDGAILLIDEIDTFLTNRAFLDRLYEVSAVNEMLAQIDSYRGILVCCTNMIERIDSAALRRFAWKIQFRELTQDGRVRCFECYFPNAKDDTAQGISHELAHMGGLTPGDFGAVWDRYSYGSEMPTAEALLCALRNELSSRQEGRCPQIGFLSHRSNGRADEGSKEIHVKTEILR